MDVDIGTVVAGKYELVRLIGKGAMGEVWAAKHSSLGGEFAIKLVEPADDVEAETAAGRFQLEAQIAAKLSRKTRHIVSVSDHGEENGLAYLVMELLEGESLEHRVQRTGVLPLAEVVAIVSQVCRALALAHEEGVFHRDLKPANVWLSKDEDGRLVVKLLDFGIARAQKSFRTRSPFVTSKDMVLGTPSYMSPEQARGLDTLDHRCDLWALAVVAYEALTKKIPFEGETVEDIFLSICTFRVVPVTTRRADLGPPVEGFFERAFAAKIDSRFSTADELAVTFEQLVTPDELEQALGPTPISARRLEMRRSDPNFNGGAALPRPPSQSDLVPTPVPTSSPAQPDPFANRPRSSPDLDPVALGDSVIPRRATSAWIIGVAAALAAVLVAVLLFITFRGSATTPAARGETGAPPPTATTIATAPPPASLTTPPPTPADTVAAPEPQPTAPAPMTSGVVKKPAPTEPKPRSSGGSTPGVQPTTPSGKTPPTVKSVKKEEVF